MTFEEQLERHLWDDDLGLARPRVRRQHRELAGPDLLLAKPADPFWDDIRPQQGRDGGRHPGEALDGAGSALHSSLGADPATWTWGRVHTTTFREVTLGESGIGPLEWYFDKGPYPVAGAAGAVDATYYQFSVAYDDPYDRRSRRPPTCARSSR